METAARGSLPCSQFPVRVCGREGLDIAGPENIRNEHGEAAIRSYSSSLGNLTLAVVYNVK